MDAEAEAQLRERLTEKYAEESSPYYATARLWDDGVIDPRDTRQVLGMAVEAAQSNRAMARAQYGVLRM